MTAILNIPAPRSAPATEIHIRKYRVAGGRNTFRFMVAPADGEPVVFRSHGEIALAIARSEMPLPRETEPAEIAAAALAGANRAGLARLRALGDADRRINLLNIDTPEMPVDLQVKKAIWGGPESRETLCIVLAGWLVAAAETTERVRPGVSA